MQTNDKVFSVNNNNNNNKISESMMSNDNEKSKCKMLQQQSTITMDRESCTTSNDRTLERNQSIFTVEPCVELDKTLKRCLHIKNQYVREFLSEMFGTTLLVLFGCASVAQYKLRKATSETNPILLTINLTFGFGIALSVLITSKTSGGHLNPAISFAAFLVGKMSVLRLFVYTLAQFIGGFIGACLVYLNYMDGLNALHNFRTIEFAGIFATYPNENLTILGGIIDQTIGTFLLVFVFLAMIDRRNNSPQDGLHWSTSAFTMGIAVSVIGMSFGYNSAYAINPARDFGPRLFTYFSGWGVQVFTAYNYFFWIPLVIPMFGAFLASVFYTILFNNTKQD